MASKHGMDWLRMERRLRAVLERVNNLPSHVRYGDTFGLTTYTPRLAEALAAAVTEIDEIIAAETRRGNTLDNGAIMPIADVENIRDGVWEVTG